VLVDCSSASSCSVGLTDVSITDTVYPNSFNIILAPSSEDTVITATDIAKLMADFSNAERPQLTLTVPKKVDPSHSDCDIVTSYKVDASGSEDAIISLNGNG